MILVWDLFVRLSHWAVALAFALAYLIEDELLVLHVWAGYLLGILVVLRVLWGVVGPRHARFTDFVYGPRQVLAYLVRLLRFNAPRHLGHSPAGGAMAVVLWIVLLAITWSGLELYALEEGRGPLAAATGPVSAGPASAPGGLLRLVSEDEAEDGEESGERRGRGRERGGEGFWEAAHEVLADLALVLVLLHIGGVILASVVHRENLAGSMVTGRKRPL